MSGNYWAVLYNSGEKVAMLFEMAKTRWGDESGSHHPYLEKPEGVKSLFREKLKEHLEFARGGKVTFLPHEETLSSFRQEFMNEDLWSIAKKIVGLHNMTELVETILMGRDAEAIAFWLSAGWEYFFKGNGWELYVKWVEDFGALEKYAQKKRGEGWKVLILRRRAEEEKTEKRRYDFDLEELLEGTKKHPLPEG